MLPFEVDRLNLRDFIARAARGAALLRETFAASMAPRTPADVRLVDEQLTIARHGTWSVAFVLPLGALLIAIASSAWVPLWRVVAWPCAVMTVCIVCDLYYRRLLARADHGPADVARRATAHTLMTFAQSVIWCAMGFMLWAPGASDDQTLLFLILACTLSGWSSMGAIHFATGAMALPAYLFALVLMPVLGANPLGIFLSALCAAYWYMMATLFHTNYRTRENMLRLEDERCALIEDLKSAKNESDLARDRAEKANSAKSEFLSNMSHELRTPLNAILGFSEIIHSKAVGADAIDQYVEYGGHIHSSGRHLLALINDILDLAKIEAGRLILRETEVDLKPLIEETIVMLAGRAQSANLVMSADVEPGFPNLFADERALRQILSNLASNAVKFTPAGGSVVLFAGINEDGGLSFGVADTGVGIAAEDHERVFESFGQGRHDAVITDHGTGLGLPIVKGLAQAHGGRVTLQSAPNRGTRVSVTLPAACARLALRAAI